MVRHLIEEYGFRRKDTPRECGRQCREASQSRMSQMSVTFIERRNSIYAARRVLYNHEFRIGFRNSM